MGHFKEKSGVHVELTPKQVAKSKEAEERKRFNAQRAKFAEMNKKRIKVKFQNIESPGVDVNFNYQGFEYWLHDGEEYNLPTYVVDHLNKLAVPKYAMKIDESGVPVHTQVGSTSRFSVVPLNMSELSK